MAIYYLLDVGHAAVAELYGVPVENFPQFVARWERSFNEADERTSDVGFDAFVIWWIKPYNISLSWSEETLDSRRVNCCGYVSEDVWWVVRLTVNVKRGGGWLGVWFEFSGV